MEIGMAMKKELTEFIYNRIERLYPTNINEVVDKYKDFYIDVGRKHPFGDKDITFWRIGMAQMLYEDFKFFGTRSITNGKDHQNWKKDIESGLDMLESLEFFKFDIGTELGPLRI